MSRDKLFKVSAKEMKWGISQGGHVAHLTDNADPNAFIEVNGNEDIGNGHDISVASLYNTVSDTATMLFFRELAENAERDFEDELADNGFKKVLKDIKGYVTAGGREDQQEAVRTLQKDKEKYEAELRKRIQNEENKQKEEDIQRLKMMNVYSVMLSARFNGSLLVPVMMLAAHQAAMENKASNQRKRRYEAAQAKVTAKVIEHEELDAYKYAAENEWAVFENEDVEFDVRSRFHRFDDPKNTLSGKLAMWVKSRDVLFPHEPAPTDVKQGYGVEDCFMLSALISLADKHPEKIREALKDNGDGTVTVRFFEKKSTDAEKKAVYVTVNKTVNRTFGGANTYASSSLWVQMIEKAYVAYKSLTVANTENSYKSIDRSSTHEFMNAFDGDADYKIPDTGFRPFGVDCDLNDDGKIAREYDTYNGESYLRSRQDGYTEREQRLYDFLKNRVDEKGEVLTVGANFYRLDNAADRRSMLHRYGIRDGHAYAVLGTFEQTDENGMERKFIRLRDPYAMFSSHYDSEYKLHSDGALSMVSGTLNAGNDNMGTFFLELKDFNHFFNSFSGMTVEAAEEFKEKYAEFAVKGAGNPKGISEKLSEDMGNSGRDTGNETLRKNNPGNGIINEKHDDIMPERNSDGWGDEDDFLSRKVTNGMKSVKERIPSGWVDDEDLLIEKSTDAGNLVEKTFENKAVKAALKESSEKTADIYSKARGLLRSKEEQRMGQIDDGKYFYSKKYTNLAADLNSARYTALGGLYSSFRDSTEMKAVKDALKQISLNLKTGLAPGDAKAALEKLSEATTAYINNPKKAHNNRWRAVETIDRFAKNELSTLAAVRSNNPLNICVDAILDDLDGLYCRLEDPRRDLVNAADYVIIGGQSLRKLISDEVIKRNPGALEKLSSEESEIIHGPNREVLGQIVLKALIEGKDVRYSMPIHRGKYDELNETDLRDRRFRGKLEKPGVLTELTEPQLEEVKEFLKKNIKSDLGEGISKQAKVSVTSRGLKAMEYKSLLVRQDEYRFSMEFRDNAGGYDSERAERIKENLNLIFEGVDLSKSDSLYDKNVACVPALCDVLEQVGNDRDKLIAKSIKTIYAGNRELFDMGAGVIPKDIDNAILKIMNSEGSRQLYAARLRTSGKGITSALTDEEMERCVNFYDDVAGKLADNVAETKYIGKLIKEVKSGKMAQFYDAVIDGKIRETRKIYADMGGHTQTDKAETAQKNSAKGNDVKKHEVLRMEERKLNK